jgi:hypothetical protein
LIDAHAQAGTSPVIDAGIRSGVRHERASTGPWIWPTLLSLDAPLVAVVWQLLFAATVHAHVAPAATAVTALAVWLIYVADRILDSFQADQDARQPVRHRFYRAHRTAFWVPFLAVLLFTCWMTGTHLDPRTLHAGIWLALAVGAYFIRVHALRPGAEQLFPKELAVAILFAAGTCLPVATGVQYFQLWFLLPVFLFVLVLWMNTSAIEYTEWLRLRDGQADRPHESTILAGSRLDLLGIAVAAVAIGASASSTFQMARPILLAIGTSAIALGVIGLCWRTIPSHIVRLTADAALLTPVLFLVVFRS